MIGAPKTKTSDLVRQIANGRPEVRVFFVLWLLSFHFVVVAAVVIVVVVVVVVVIVVVVVAVVVVLSSCR